MQHFIKLLLVPILLGATKYAGEFQELGVSARACAMGGVGVALCEDPATIYFNPAGTVFTTRSIMLLHAENFGGIVKNEFGSVVLPKGNLAAGIGVQYLSAGEIKFTTLADTTLPPSNDNPPIAYDTVTANDVVLYLNGARSSGPFSYGVNVKVYYRNLSVITGLGGGLDLGIRLNLKYLRLGALVRDFVLSPMVWSNRTKETISSEIVFGLAPQLPFDELFSTVALETDIVKSMDISGFSVKFGLEYSYKNTFFGRLGWAERNYTLGVGLKIKKFSFDYAFVTHSVLHNSNKFSAGLEF